jgi:hypothetical protein
MDSTAQSMQLDGRIVAGNCDSILRQLRNGLFQGIYGPVIRIVEKGFYLQQERSLSALPINERNPE